MRTKLPAVLLWLAVLGAAGPAAAEVPTSATAQPVLQPTPLPRLRATAPNASALPSARRPPTDRAALLAALAGSQPRPRTLLVPLVKKSAIGVVIVRRF